MARPSSGSPRSAVGPLARPRRLGIFEGTSAEVLPYPFALESSDSTAIHKVNQGIGLGHFWATPLGAYEYTTVEASLPSSTIGELVRDIWTGVTTSTLISHAPLLIAGADLAPSFSVFLSSVTATTPGTLNVRREYLRSRFSVAVVDAKMEDFEFGTDSQLSQRVGQLVLRFGGEALGTLASTIAEARLPLAVLGELLRTIGRIRSTTTHEEQRAVLLNFLTTASDVRVRHVAATGLAALDDPTTIPAMQRALESERSERLRMHLRQVLAQLESTGAALRHR